MWRRSNDGSYSFETGGNKRFHYTKEDLERIENTDTTSTRAFKKAYKEWQENKHRAPRPKRYGKKHNVSSFTDDGERAFREYHRIQERQKKVSWKLIVKITLIILVAFFMWDYYNAQPHEVTEEQVVEDWEKTSTEETTLAPITFTEYVNNPKKYASTDVELTGYLLYGLEEGKYDYFLVDENGLKIRISRLPSHTKDILEKNVPSTELYKAQGKFKNYYDGPVLDTISVKSTPPPTLMITNSDAKLVNITKNVTKTVKGDTIIAQVWNKTKSFFVEATKCNESERRHLLQCIPIITCEDGTLHPSCSITKPLQCLNGTLVENALRCGCPDSYRREGDSCVEIKMCSDGTLYGKCARNKPSYCDNGRLSARVDKCGCPYGAEPYENSCVELEWATERKIFDLTNIERESRGVRSLSWSDRQANKAKRWSQSMASTGNFYHNPNMGYGAENINMMPTGNVEGMGYVSRTSDDLAEAMVVSWMNSPGHRANILDSSLGSLGVGVAYDDSLYYYATQNFGFS